jgi:O-antigen/teichoic acid export membrane protein
MFVTFLFMLLLSAISYPLIYTLIGLKWKFAAEYLQILCFIGMLYPLHSLNLNMLKVEGRSDLFLKLEIIKKVIAIPIIFSAFFFGIKIMLLGMLINSILAYYLNSYWSGKLINYSIKEQIGDILPSFFFAASISFLVYLVSIIFTLDNIITLIIQLVTSVFLVFSLGELFNFKEYIEIKKIVFDFVDSKIIKNI